VPFRALQLLDDGFTKGGGLFVSNSANCVALTLSIPRKSSLFRLEQFLVVGHERAWLFEFWTKFKREYDYIERNKLHTLEMAELMDFTYQLNTGLLERWSTPIITEFYVMMMNGNAHRWLEKAKVKNPSLVLNK